jgi:hypothetical protein
MSKYTATQDFGFYTKQNDYFCFKKGDVIPFESRDDINRLLNKGLAREVEEQPIKKAEYSNAIPSKEVSPAPKKRYKKKAD